MVDTQKLKDLMLDIQRSAWYLDQAINNIESFDDVTDEDHMYFAVTEIMSHRRLELECICGLEMSDREKRVWNEIMHALKKES